MERKNATEYALSVLVAGFASLALLAAGPKSAKAKPVPARMPPMSQARADIRWVRPICVETNRYIGWPSVCRLKNGDVLAVFSGDRDDHVCPHGKIQMVRSHDDGETWSPPQTIADGPIDDRDVGIVQLPDGELFAFYFTSTAYRSLFKAHPEYKEFDDKLTPEARAKATGNFAVWSRDNGKTWSAPRKLDIKGQAPHGPTLLRDGSLLQLGRYWDQWRYTIVTAERSTDGGRTWELLCPAVPDSDGENGRPNVFHEPYAVQLADGTIVGQLRREYGEPKNDSNYLRQTMSKDGGRTWSPMVKTPMHGLPPHLVALPDGKLVSVYGKRQENPCAECAAISDDGGLTWDVKNEIVLSYSPDRRGPDMGYPASCILANGDILTVYYQPCESGGKPCLMATRWHAK